MDPKFRDCLFVGNKSPAGFFDGGNSAYAANAGATDLDGTTRVHYSTPGAARIGGNPVIDLGCYESDPVNLGSLIMIR